MTLIHIVLFTFKPEVTQAHKNEFVRELKKLKDLPSVKDGRMIVGSPSSTEGNKWSNGFEFALVSYHENLDGLEQYTSSKEHHHITSTYMFPFDQNVCRVDFEVDPEDEYMCAFGS